MASFLWYLAKDLNLLDLFNRNVGLAAKCAMVKVLEKVKEDEPLLQTSGYDQWRKQHIC